MAVDEDEDDLQRAFQLSLSQIPADPQQAFDEGNLTSFAARDNNHHHHHVDNSNDNDGSGRTFANHHLIVTPFDAVSNSSMPSHAFSDDKSPLPPEAKRFKNNVVVFADAVDVRASSSFKTSEQQQQQQQQQLSVAAELLVNNETPDERLRRIQREQRAAAAEKRLQAQKVSTVYPAASKNRQDGERTQPSRDKSSGDAANAKSDRKLSVEEANELFNLVFGKDASREAMNQWSHQGFRFSNDPETSLGLVQSEGGPCGVLAPIQALIIKHLIFQNNPNSSHLSPRNDDLVFSKEQQDRALVLAMAEALWLAGNDHACAVVATVEINPSPSPSLPPQSDDANKAKDDITNLTEDDRIAKALEEVSLVSADDLQNRLHLCYCSSFQSLIAYIRNSIPVFRSRLGALLFLFSAILSRTLKCVQLDRDDPEQTLVTQPFGHASQEIVNLLLCGQAVANVFDDNMDMGGGMFLKGIKSTVEIGFLTLLESLNLCTVGKNFKNPKYPIWVVGSETHYTVLFALSRSVLEENEVEVREAKIRKAFDELDMSGGGGFISPDALQKLTYTFGIELPQEYVNGVVNQGIVIWNEFKDTLLELDVKRGGLKSQIASEGKRFDLFHFNGIAKSVDGRLNQRPRLTRLHVYVPPRFDQRMSNQDMVMYDASKNAAPDLREGMGDSGEAGASSGAENVGEGVVESSSRGSISQHAPLVECIRTRWKCASCNWAGDPPSIV